MVRATTTCSKSRGRVFVRLKAFLLAVGQNKTVQRRRITGLTARPELNGALVDVVTVESAVGVRVRLEDGTEVAVKRENLEDVAGDSRWYVTSTPSFKASSRRPIGAPPPRHNGITASLKNYHRRPRLPGLRHRREERRRHGHLRRPQPSNSSSRCVVLLAFASPPKLDLRGEVPGRLCGNQPVVGSSRRWRGIAIPSHEMQLPRGAGFPHSRAPLVRRES